jgi:hypothetical protein
MDIDVVETAVFTGDHTRRGLLDRNRRLAQGDASLVLDPVLAGLDPRSAN